MFDSLYGHWNHPFIRTNKFKNTLILHWQLYFPITDGGNLQCVYSSAVGSAQRVHVYNLDTTTDESTYYRFTCLVRIHIFAMPATVIKVWTIKEILWLFFFGGGGFYSWLECNRYTFLHIYLSHTLIPDFPMLRC